MYKRQDSPYEFTTLHGNYKIKKGVNELNGDQALCFVRERYALPSGDFDRGKNQQRLLKAMLKKAMSPKIITNYSNILAAVEGSFETDMSSDDIKSFCLLYTSFLWKISSTIFTDEMFLKFILVTPTEPFGLANLLYTHKFYVRNWKNLLY